MMRLPAFRFVAPDSLQAVVDIVADSGPRAALVAGGTDLYPNMKRRQVKPEIVVGLHNVRELAGVRRTDEGGLSIGAVSALTDLERHPLLRELYPSVVEAILTISTPLLRNMGTIGGNVCLDTRCHFLNQTHFWRQALGSCMKADGEICRVATSSPRCLAISSADLPPLLIALGATACLVSAAGERAIPLSELYRDEGIKCLSRAADEILTEIVLPPPDGVRAIYLKLRRRGTFDFPALGVAAAVQMNGDHSCQAARIVLGAVTSRPMEVGAADRLVGNEMSAEAIQTVADETMQLARPLQLADYTHSYRKKMVGLYVRRALEQLVN
ncbi:MAG: FAD binding domain-containing protein [Anaerolineales bacterium]|jgi:4-hydroxybenzoyl-CoA reductase subunit beta|nr:FAD binding domain-containing protein [Anaerolineales bacterium]|tara:strand:+ start:22302 stop:23282 length:981 start_codon:yes stop_codon:yes gene_type:complete